MRRMIVVSLMLVLCAGLTVMAFPRGGSKVLVAIGHEYASPPSDPGGVTCIGGEPTGNPFFPCSPGTKRIHTRGRVSSGNTYANLIGNAADMFDGTNVAVMNCNLDGSYVGHCWGSFEWTIPGKGGVWEGNWSGHFDLVNFVASFSGNAVGAGGELDGLRMKLEMVYPGGVPYGTFVATVSDR
jgi:hypothetical protein